jgi:Protein of unknown function (DUF3306)
MTEDKEGFLARWSRLKQEKPAAPAPETETAPPALPPVDTLTPESDFSGFMHPKVKEELRRMALKKLFNDPHFNVPDPFEPYSGDWTGGEPIPDELLATLNQARTVLFADKKEPAAEEAATPKEETNEAKQEKDESGR